MTSKSSTTFRVTVRDGVQLSANLFLPVAKTPGERFGAILEMIPYRKDDWRYNTDYSRMTWLARPWLRLLPARHPRHGQQPRRGT